MKNKRNAQVSIEYMLMIGFVLFLIVPGIYIAYTYSTEASYETITNQIDQIGQRIIDNVEYVYPHGKNSRTSVEFDLPSRVQDIYVKTSGASQVGGELVFIVDIDGKNHSMVFFTDVQMYLGDCSSIYNMSTNFIETPGKKKVRIESCGNNVSLSAS